MSSNDSGNAAQWEHWNSVAGPKWVAFSDRLDRALTEVGQILLQAADPLRDEAVLDIGCGTGGMLVPLAAAVGNRGVVVGIDISAPMLDAARHRLGGESVGNVTLIEGDVQSYAFKPAAFDLLVSRFGVMFYTDPVAAFRNLLRATRAGGRLRFVCWAPLQENPQWSLALAAVTRRLGPPEPKPLHAPGPLAFSDPTYVEEILHSAGFAEIAISRQSPMLIGTSPEDEAEFLCTMGPAAALIAERKPVPNVIQEIKSEIVAALLQFVRDNRMLIPASIYLVQARRAG
jgi:SAM-dependent methyltransferase